MCGSLRFKEGLLTGIVSKTFVPASSSNRNKSCETLIIQRLLKYALAADGRNSGLLWSSAQRSLYGEDSLAPTGAFLCSPHLFAKSE